MVAMVAPSLEPDGNPFEIPFLSLCEGASVATDGIQLGSGGKDPETAVSAIYRFIRQPDETRPWDN